ncbi:MAG: MFS transporter [Mycetocola sp.]
MLVQAAWIGVRLMIGYRAIDSGADAAFLGLLAGTLAAPALVAALPIGRLSDRTGGSVLTAFGIVVMAAGTLVLVWVPGLWILLVSSAVVGLGNVLLMVGQQTFVAHRTRGVASDSGFGTLSAAASIGQLVGPPLVTVIATVAWFGSAETTGDVPDTTAGLLAAAGCIVLAAPCYVFLRRADLAHPATSNRSVPAASTRSVLGTPGLWRALVVSGFILVTMDLVYAFVPVWATEKDIDVVVVGWLLALRALVSVASRLGLTRLVVRHGRKTLLIVAMAIGIASLIALPFSNETGAIAVMIGLGICLGLPQPLTLAWVVGITRSRDHGAALGLRMSANRLAQVSIPIAVALVAAPLGVAGIFWANALLLTGSAVLVSRSDPDAA